MATYGLTANDRTARATALAEAPAAERAESWLDAGRILAVVAVVMLHVCAPLTWQFQSQSVWWVGNIYNSAGRWCVPVFVMVSGALLLDPSRRSTVGAFYRRRLARVGLPLVAWTLVYFIWSEIRSANPPSPTQDIFGIAAGRPYYHLWFLYMLIGLYLLTPILKRFTATASRRELRITVAVLLALGVADSFSRFVLNVGQPNALTLFVPYIGYYLAGYLIRRYEFPSRRSAWTYAAVFGLALVVTALATYFFYWVGRGSVGDWIGDYLSPTTLIATFALFMLLRAALPDGWPSAHPSLSRATAFGGVASFGVYLVHPMLLEALPGLDGIRGGAVLPPLVGVPVAIALVIAVSLAIVEVLRRIPATREFV